MPVLYNNSQVLDHVITIASSSDVGALAAGKCIKHYSKNQPASKYQLIKIHTQIVGVGVYYLIVRTHTLLSNLLNHRLLLLISHIEPTVIMLSAKPFSYFPVTVF